MSDSIYYHGGTNCIYPGDIVEIRLFPFWRYRGRVIYVPNLSPRHVATQDKFGDYVAIRLDSGRLLGYLVSPNSRTILRTVHLRRRGHNIPYIPLAPDERLFDYQIEPVITAGCACEIYYHNSTTQVRLGDVVELRKLWLWHNPGRIVYVPGESPKHSDFEYGGLRYVGIRKADSGLVLVTVIPETSRISRTVAFVSRDIHGDFDPIRPCESPYKEL
jgi:hypothetical protein